MFPDYRPMPLIGTMKNCQSAFVISPTEYGGQIEHAFDTAVGLALSPDVQEVRIITRVGAKEYLNNPGLPNVEVVEILPPRRVGGGVIRNAYRPLRQVLDLVLEHHLIASQIRRAKSAPVLVVLDSSRYPWPRLLVQKRTPTRIALFVHNAKPHTVENKLSLRQRFLLHLERLCINRVDLAVTHGETQRETVATYASTPTASVPLPTTSFLSSPESGSDVFLELEPRYALCIGELRENKGVEIAMTAAKIAQVPLVVAGKSDDEAMAQKLRNIAADHDRTQLFDRFLDKGEFDRLIVDAGIVVIPYTNFDAQSGILAKAMSGNKRIIASDLPAIREQTSGYTNISFVRPSSPSELASRLQSEMASEVAGLPSTHADPETEWKAVASVLLGNE